MRKIPFKKETLLFFGVVSLFLCVSGLSLHSINLLQGTGRVINYTGIVRGATQRLIKQEICGYPNDLLITRLDSIVRDLFHEGGENRLIVLQDKIFLHNMNQVQTQWDKLKEEIMHVRAGARTDYLYELSEEYFDLVDRTVSAAEFYSETQVTLSKNLLMGANFIFVLFMLISMIYYLRAAALKRRAVILDKLAYVDTLTQIPNRASCERQIEQYAATPLSGHVAVLLFDMNNLKKLNDLKGHQAGDKVITEFGRILQTSAEDFGFIGRYGGDEFLGIFRGASQEDVEDFLARTNSKVIAYNLLSIDELESISFAVGYSIGTPGDNDLVKLIGEADRRMYERKRQMRENQDT